MLDSIDKTIFIGIIVIVMIVEISPLEEFEIALWIGMVALNFSFEDLPTSLFEKTD